MILKDLGELADLQSKVKQVRLLAKLDKRGLDSDIKELFELITKAAKKYLRTLRTLQKQLRS